VAGSKTVEVTNPYERQPMWHGKVGALAVLAKRRGLRIDDIDGD
jgi:hypothetical protein